MKTECEQALTQCIPPVIVECATETTVDHDAYSPRGLPRFALQDPLEWATLSCGELMPRPKIPRCQAEGLELAIQCPSPRDTVVAKKEAPPVVQG